MLRIAARGLTFTRRAVSFGRWVGRRDAALSVAWERNGLPAIESDMQKRNRGPETFGLAAYRTGTIRATKPPGAVLDGGAGARRFRYTSGA
jgi:hypothetical protein